MLFRSLHHCDSKTLPTPHRYQASPPPHTHTHTTHHPLSIEDAAARDDKPLPPQFVCHANLATNHPNRKNNRQFAHTINIKNDLSNLHIQETRREEEDEDLDEASKTDGQDDNDIEEVADKPAEKPAVPVQQPASSDEPPAREAKA